MKKIILLLLLFSQLAVADNSIPLYFKTFFTTKNIKTIDIQNYALKFKTLEEQNISEEFEFERQLEELFNCVPVDEVNKTKWIEIDLGENIASGNYILAYSFFEFNQSSFKQSQSPQKFSLFQKNFMVFHYNKKKDKQKYYVKTLNPHSSILISLYAQDTLSSYTEAYTLKLFISFFLFGLIFMTAIYNGALYYYTREKYFFYYMVMQFFMVIFLFYYSDMVKNYIIEDVASRISIAFLIYSSLSVVVTFFAMLFIRTFLSTKKYLPKQDKILHYLTRFLFFDMIFFPLPLTLVFFLYIPISIYILWIGSLRLQQGFKPAGFFILGWLALMTGLLSRAYIDEKLLFFDPILLGSTIESIFLSMALAHKLQEINYKKEKQKSLMIHQSKLASMGELLGNISHQWRQPLTRLSFILMNIEQKDTTSLHQKKLDEANAQLEFMSQTIDDFKDFYKPKKDKESFLLSEETKNVIELLYMQNISIALNIIEDSTIINYKNEYKQVILNLLSNAKEVLIEREIKNQKIIITINKQQITISDNAGGISKKHINKIFDPYYTTKRSGLGVGLYMSKVIIENNMGGSLAVFNGEKGAEFLILFTNSLDL